MRNRNPYLLAIVILSVGAICSLVGGAVSIWSVGLGVWQVVLLVCGAILSCLLGVILERYRVWRLDELFRKQANEFVDLWLEIQKKEIEKERELEETEPFKEFM